MSPTMKVYLQGVPLRVELGMKDLEKRIVVSAWQDV